MIRPALAAAVWLLVTPAAATETPAQQGWRAARPHELILIGDSITDHNSARPHTPYGGNGSAAGLTQGWMVWASALLGQAIDWDPVYGNFGVSGNQTADVLNRMPPILATNADTAILLVGVNDIGHGVALQTLETNYQAIVGQLQAARIRPVLCTLTPVPSSYFSAAGEAELQAFNQWVAGYAAAQGLELLDFYSALIDPNSPTADALPGLLQGDHLHPSPAGAYAMGQLLATQWRALYPHPSPVLYRGPGDDYDRVAAPRGNLTVDAAFSAGGGTQDPSGPGPVPLGWGLVRATAGGTGTVTTSLVPAADGLGDWLQIQFQLTGGVTNESWVLQQARALDPADQARVGLPFAPGRILEGFAEVSWSDGPFGQASFFHSFADKAVTITTAALDQPAGADPLPTFPIDVVQRTPSLVIPAANGPAEVRTGFKIVFDSSTSFTGTVGFRLPTLRDRPI